MSSRSSSLSVPASVLFRFAIMANTSSFCFFFLLLIVAMSSAWFVSATTLISESDGRLPMGLSSVITDLEAEGVEHVTTACILTSRGMTPSQRAHLVSKLFGLSSSNDDNEAAVMDVKSLTAFGTTPEDDDVDGLAIAQPDALMTSNTAGTAATAASSAANTAASTVVACGGTVVYLPSPIDLARGEGLFDGGLGPSMERLLQAKQQQDRDGDAKIKKSCLVVVVPSQMTVETARMQLEKAAAKIIPNLVLNPSSSSSSSRGNHHHAMVLEDVFDTVQYVPTPVDDDDSSSSNTLEDFLTEHLEGSSCEPSEALSLIASTVDVLSLVTSGATSMTTANANAMIQSPQDLAAARQLGPAARTSMEEALASVQRVLQAQTLVTNYGELCQAVVAQAVDNLGTIKGSALSKQIQTSFKQELYAELADLFQQQLKVLQVASFEDFRKSLSQLKVSPLLQHHMEEAMKTSIATFTKTAKGMVCKKGGSAGGNQSLWSIGPARTEYARMLKDYCAERLLAARASGAFRPVPRKGVTVGLHWLLPKPFGNDFRQEPWKVHAMDNLVYVPPDKVTNVSPDDVKSGGDWRKAIVPSPASRDMVFMQ